MNIPLDLIQEELKLFWVTATVSEKQTWGINTNLPPFPN